jgi:hypothetical protein
LPKDGLSEWIKQTFWDNGHNRVGKVISYSVSEDELRRVAERMNRLVYFPFEPVRLNQNQFPCPDIRSVRVP